MLHSQERKQECSSLSVSWSSLLGQCLSYGSRDFPLVKCKTHKDGTKSIFLVSASQVKNGPVLAGTNPIWYCSLSIRDDASAGSRV